MPWEKLFTQYMSIRFATAFLAALLSGCAATQTYSDTTNGQERKAYIACAVRLAFSNTERSIPPQEVALDAINQCGSERQAVYDRLVAENADKPFGASFVESYMNELHTVMLEHIALRLTEVRSAKGI